MTEETEGLTGDDKIIAEAKKRFRRCEDWEAEARRRFVADLKFAEGDSDNGWQWPDDMRAKRATEDKPCLTVNKTRQHNLQVINDAKQNKPGVNVRPVGGKASYQAAQVFEGLVRHIEYISKAESAYDTGTEFQVKGGIGWVRLVTDYAGPDSFDQEIFIRRVKDALSVYLDPDIQFVDGSDARFGFVVDDMARDPFEEEYPKFKDRGTQNSFGTGESWFGKDKVRRLEYYRKVTKTRTMLAFTGPDGRPAVKRQDEIDLPAGEMKRLLAHPDTKTRQVEESVVEWYMIVGDEIADRNVWPGKYIPLFRVIGEETVIDGRMDRKGHTRALKDPQRIYNYWNSSSVEHVALQSKIPYVSPARAIEGYETYWATANTDNHAVLPFNDIDDQGRPIERPEREQPPTMAQAYIEGMQIAERQLMMAGGQYQSQFGENENAKSGKAIGERQRQGDTATYHFIDNLGVMIRFLGAAVIDLAPKVYDTARVLKILAEDGTQGEVHLDPNAPQAYQEVQLGQQVKRIFNPNVGRYEVEADIGPAYASKRDEAFAAISQILERAPQLVGLIGDLLFKAADFPLADEIAERLARMVPPQALGTEDPSAQHVQQVQQQAQELVQTLQRELQQVQQELTAEKLKAQSKDALRAVEQYDAITRRLAVIEKHITTPKDFARMSHDLLTQEQGVTLRPPDSQPQPAQDIEMER